MGSVERRERQKADLRAQLLDAARTIVQEHGLEGLTMRKIAEAVEYAPGTIYLHFPSRDDLVRELVRDGFLELVNYLKPAAQIADPRERLAAIGYAYARFGVERPATYRTIFLQPPDISRALADMRPGCEKGPDGDGVGAFGILEQTVAELIARGDFRQLPATVVAETIWGWLHGLVALRATCDQKMLTDFDTSVRLAIEGVHRAFAA